ncbi:hypothetical protein FRX31_019302 [Thalictrum thalictroides]|uniref:Uncharacterized protein n=1 Tax=Thalictrum thalictroides TaxID=46969 RepID=A0A7J6W3M5_THATH|nr:hypothetical protein FRX31_019302 [Thalictrum thalictroides]
MFTVDAKVNELIEQGRSNENALYLVGNSMANMIRSTTIHRSLEKDQLVWTKTSSGDFSVRSAYNELICRDNPVYWHGIV